MGRKVFVSYKYNDNNVHPLKSGTDEYLDPTKVRHYVDELQILLAGDHINKGEADGEDLSNFKDSTIESKLRNKIFDSSVTIVVISPNMKEIYKPESEQWIPWEIAYSIKEHTRNDTTSQTNAVLAVVLPDKNNSYNYFIENRTCCTDGCRFFNTNTIFQILRDNMFNIKKPTYMPCTNGDIIYNGDFSYIYSVKWSDFKVNINKYINIAISINNKIYDFDITKTIN